MLHYIVIVTFSDGGRMPIDFVSAREPSEGKKYDVIILLGKDTPGREAIQQEPDASGMSYCIIGDGAKDSHLTKDQITALHDKIDEHTNIIINGQ